MEEKENLSEETVEKDEKDEKVEQLTKALNEERGKRKSMEQNMKVAKRR